MNSPHEPFHRAAPGAKTLALFIHGFMGSPRQFTSLADFVQQSGFSAAALLLPGHGSDGTAFSRARLADWRRHVDSEVRKYSAHYESIVVAGHSMGGLLGLGAAETAGHSIKAQFLISSPMKMKTSLKPFFRGVRSLLPSQKENAVIAAYRESSGVGKTPLYIYPLWLRQVGDLKWLISETAAMLPAVSGPVVTLHSRNDETVHFDSAALFRAGLKNAELRQIILRGSMHAYYTAEDKATIRDELLALLRAVGGQ